MHSTLFRRASENSPVLDPPLRRTKTLAAWVVALAVAGAMVGTAQPAMAATTGPAYTYDRSSASTITDRWRLYAPSYVVYSDARTAAEAEAVVKTTLNMTGHLDEYKTAVMVMTPANGSSWDAVGDLANFEALERTLASGYVLNNLKVIGIGSGATFVNNVISQHAFAVAGIYTYGGTIDPKLRATIPVPAYIHASGSVANYYRKANGAYDLVDRSWKVDVFTNRDSDKSLQRVAVSKLSDRQESPAAGFVNAWKTVFSKNYRNCMDTIEFYYPGFDPIAQAYPWRLETYVMYDELGITVNTVTQNLMGTGMNQWYEYLPRATTREHAKSVPLVVMLHGNGNDNRTQAETSGWPELAAKEGIILVAPEWQGNPAFTALGEKGTMALIDLLEAKYPQIDPSRVYLTGLSAGAVSSLNWGISDLERIAGIEASSGPFGSQALFDAAYAKRLNGTSIPMYAITGTKDMYHPLPVTATGFYLTMRGYALVNGITIPDAPDLTKNPYYGVQLEGQRWIQMGGNNALVGTLSNAQGPMIKLVAVDPYGHWNYKPAIPDIWNFLSRYSRDLKTGKLIVTPTDDHGHR